MKSSTIVAIDRTDERSPGRDAPAGPVVLSFPTIMDGLVLRWYRDVAHAAYRAERVSASRNGVRATGYLHDIPANVLADAEAVHQALAAGSADVFSYVTHRRVRPPAAALVFKAPEA